MVKLAAEVSGNLPVRYTVPGAVSRLVRFAKSIERKNGAEFDEGTSQTGGEEEDLDGMDEVQEDGDDAVAPLSKLATVRLCLTGWLFVAMSTLAFLKEESRRTFAFTFIVDDFVMKGYFMSEK